MHLTHTKFDGCCCCHDAVRAIEAYNKKDVMLYDRAVREFKRRCRYFDIQVPDNPFLLESDTVTDGADVPKDPLT